MPNNAVVEGRSFFSPRPRNEELSPIDRGVEPGLLVSRYRLVVREDDLGNDPLDMEPRCMTFVGNDLGILSPTPPPSRPTPPTECGDPSPIAGFGVLVLGGMFGIVGGRTEEEND